MYLGLTPLQSETGLREVVHLNVVEQFEIASTHKRKHIGNIQQKNVIKSESMQWSMGIHLAAVHHFKSK